MIDIDSGRRVLNTEAQALEALAASLGEDFVAALDRLDGIAGRIVVTGMGKSGHVARKIAATLASTGTPSFYVHPGEASHGDLGMIARDDAIVALSNSGETPELADLVDYANRFAIPLIALTGRRPSTLADAAHVTLLLPPAEEACPMGLAPTTSTTAMMALGDALAVALLERKGFTSDDFRSLHPGGQLGRRLLRVADLMHGGDGMPLAPAGSIMREAILTMTAKRFGCVGVVDLGGRLIGIVTDGDLRRHIDRADLMASRVETIMTRLPKTIRPEALAAEAVQVMNERAITSLFAIDGDRRPVGILHVHDCLRAGQERSA